MKTKKEFCTYCMKERECTYKEKQKNEVIDNIKIEYLEKYYVCNTCGNKIYGDLLDYNTLEANKKLREKTGLITIDEINEIIKKYNIGKKPLSLVLGLGEITITRYCDGQNPTKENSVLLKQISTNPWLYEMYLTINKDKITDIAYKKSLGKTKQLELISDNSKLYEIALYFIKQVKEIDALSLQKLIYFANGLSKPFLGKLLVLDTAESWKYGPVYKDIYDSFSYYAYNRIDYEELLKNYNDNLDEKEKEFLDEIIMDFGCYSGKILREMTHLTDPWVNARVGLEDNEPSDRVIELDEMNKYFQSVYNDYNMKKISDIQKYSDSLFKKAKEFLIN